MPDKLIHNARFYLEGGFKNRVKALLVRDGRIVEHLEDYGRISNDTERIDLGGGYAYPAFTDAHTHCYSGGLYQDGIDLSACAGVSDLLELIRARKKHGGILFAWRFDENLIKEKRFPTRKELDSVCPGQPLLLRRIDGHSCLLNSAALALVPGLKTDNEVLTGEDNDFAVNWLQDNCDEETIIRAYHKAAEAALRGGFAAIHTMIGDAHYSVQHYRLIRDRLSEFPVRYELYPQSFDVKAALELGSQRIGGCILADGSIGSHTAALTSPYRDKNSLGNLYQTDEFWRGFVAEAHDSGLQVCVHCIGDAAIGQINRAYAQFDPAEVGELRHQLIHCEVTPDGLFEEIVASGAVPVMQPAFDLLWGGDGGFYAGKLGVERSRQMNRWGGFTRRGVRVCGSSDWYITPLDIAMSIHALTRHHNPLERVSPQEAIAIYTANNAWLNHEEGSRGELKPGFHADLSVLDADLTRDFEPEAVKVQVVLREGKLVHVAG